MKTLEHIGIAVEDLESSIKQYEQILGVAPYKREVVESEGVETVFFNAGESKVELLGALHDQSPIATFLQKKGPGIHHMAFRVDDIEKEIEILEFEGYKLINSKPKLGADNMLIAFLHPKSTGGVLIELCMPKD